MNLLHYFVVKVPKRFKDEIEVGDQTLYIETKFNEFEHRVNEGEVVHTPLKYDTPVKPGDTLYFHHLVVINGGMPFADYKDHYVVSFDPDVAVNSHAYAYKPQGSSQVLPLQGWTVLKPAFEEDVSHAMFEVVDYTPPTRTTGVVAAGSYDLHQLGVQAGDTVGFKKNRDYSFKVDGEEYFRTRTEDLLYVV